MVFDPSREHNSEAGNERWQTNNHPIHCPTDYQNAYLLRKCHMNNPVVHIQSSFYSNENEPLVLKN